MVNFQETLSNLFGQLQAFWSSQSRKRKIVYVASLAGVLAVAFLSAFYLNRVAYAVLYRGLDPQEANEIMTLLEEQKVNAQVDDAGTIMVPESDEARLRMQLSSEGYPRTALNYDLFQNSSDLMTSDFEKRKYLVFQLQDRLQESIKTLQPIENAIVTISIPEQDSFVLEQDRVPASASVVLQIKTGLELNKSQVNGIEELVAKSVPGLENENISIVDGSGTVLNTMHSDSEAFSASTKIDMEKQVDENIKEKIITLLEPIYGRSGISVAVNVAIDFNKAVSEETRYNPVVDSNGAISKIDKATENAAGTGKGGASGVPGSETNSDIPSYQQSASEAGSGYQKEQQSIDYLVNQIKEQIQKDGGEIKDISASVIIDQKQLSRLEADKVRNIVAFGSGIAPEKVSVENMEFAAGKNLQNQVNKALNPTQVSWQRILTYGLPAAAALIIGAIIIFLICKKSKKKTMVKKNEKQVLERFAQASASRAIQEQQDLPGAIVLNETKEQALKRQIKEFSSQNPVIVAQLLKTWLKEENDRNA